MDEIVFFYRKNGFLDQVAERLSEKFGGRLQIVAIPATTANYPLNAFFRTFCTEGLAAKKILADWTCSEQIRCWFPENIHGNLQVIRQGFDGYDLLQEYIATVANVVLADGSPLVILKASLADYAYRDEVKMTDAAETDIWISELAKHGIQPTVVESSRQLEKLDLKKYIVVAHHHGWSDNEGNEARMWFDVVSWSSSDDVRRYVTTLDAILAS